MRSNRVSKRRRQEITVPNSTDSAEDNTVSDGYEYFHKAKGKRKIREDDVRLQEEEEEAKEVKEAKDEERVVQVCGICLTEEEMERGRLDCCEHYFCFGCIMEWAKVESRCPTCKQRFVTVVRPSVPGMPRSRPRTFHIPLRNQVYEPSEEEIRLFTDPYLHVVCTECQDAGDERLLLLCDRCDAAAHTYCVGLGRSVPRGDWFCNMCSIQGVSNEQEHEEEYNNEGHDEEEEEQQQQAEIEMDEDDSNFQVSDIVAGVQPVRRTRPPRRQASTPRLSRVGGRHTRLHPAPAISQEAQALVNQEAGPSSSVSSDVETTPGAARTLSSQRLIRQRVNDIRNNWDRLRRGFLRFSSITQPGPRTRASQAQDRQPEAAPSDDVSQAWSMMEQARALREVAAAPNPASGSRAGGNRVTSHGRIPSGRVSVGPSRFDQTQEQAVRNTGTALSNQLPVDNAPRTHRDQVQEQAVRNTGTALSNQLPVENAPRTHRDRVQEQAVRNTGTALSNQLPVENAPRTHRDRVQEQAVRNTGTALSNQLPVENAPRTHRDQVQEQASRRTNAREAGHLAEGRSRGHRGASEERSSRREDNHENRSRDHRGQSMERNSRGENARECNGLVEGSTSGRDRGSRRSGRQDNDSVQAVQARNGDGNGGTVAVRFMPEGLLRANSVAERNLPGSSGENERRQATDTSGRRTQPEGDDAHRPHTRTSVADRSGRRAQPECEEAHRPRTRERRDMKEHVAQYVKAELKPLYRLGHIDKQQHIKIARMATQELLAAFGIEHLGPETRAFGSASSACNHLSSPSTSALFPNCCMQCVRHNVNKVVGVLVKKVMGTGFL